MRIALAGSLALLFAACGPRNIPVENTPPRWLTEKDQVRIEIIRTLIESSDDARALELIRIMRAENVSEHTPQRMPLTLLAAIMIPWPVPQRMMPRSQSPEATNSAAA